MPWRADSDPNPSHPTCDRVRDWIDFYLEDPGLMEEDGDALGPARREALEAHAAGCPDCRAEIALARRLRGGLREGMPLLACPPEVSDAVLRVARLESEAAAVERRSGWTDRLRGWLGGGTLLRPALAAAALLLLLLAGPVLYRAVMMPDAEAPRAAEAPTAPTTAEDSGFTEAEIAEAEEQARMILAYVASVGRDAGRAVQEDVFESGIARPTRQAVEGLRTAGLDPEATEANRGEGQP